MIGSLIPVSFPQAGKEGKAGEHRSQSHPTQAWFNYRQLARERVSDAFVCLSPLGDNCPYRCRQGKRLCRTCRAANVTELRSRAAAGRRKGLKGCYDGRKKQPCLFQPCWKREFVTGYAGEKREQGGKWHTVKNLLPAKNIHPPLSLLPLVLHTQETPMDPAGSSSRPWGRNPNTARVDVGASRGSLRSCPSSSSAAFRVPGQCLNGFPSPKYEGEQQLLLSSSFPSPAPPWGCPWVWNAAASASKLLFPPISPSFSRAATLLPCLTNPFTCVH